jgi:glycosyltransferase involved in cell wall biosynthesis
MVSTFAVSPPMELASLEFVPVAFSGIKANPSARVLSENLDGAIQIHLRTRVRQLLGPFTLPSSADKLTEIIHRIQPDLIHAMRIPFEGMLASHAKTSSPLIVSVWGNDFTLHGVATSRLRDLTKFTLNSTDGLHVDCNRDLRLAMDWGYPSTRSAVVLPGAGGIEPTIFHPSRGSKRDEKVVIHGRKLEIDSGSPVIVNPRGFRDYVRNDTFFKSIPMILEQFPQTAFLCPSMKGVREAEKWITSLGIASSVFLLPKLRADEMAAVYRRSLISVSPSEHDGTPNTLLESLACGCFPIAGELESIKEWIEDGSNGLLFDPSKPGDLAEAVLRAFRSQDLLAESRKANLEMVKRRAIRSEVMQIAEEFYSSYL